MRRQGNLYQQVTSTKNLLHASKKAFIRKKTKSRVSNFYFNLENEIIEIQQDLINLSYKPSPYGIFEIKEPKPRSICCSSFRDRIVHHAVCAILEPIFEQKMIFDTYACRRGKGTHLAIEKAKYFTRRYSYFLKCDIRKYFHSIDHLVLKNMLRGYFKDKKLMQLLEVIINHQVPVDPVGKGLPIGNLTSQYFANIYLSDLDHFIKENLKMNGYIRYMDDFIVFSNNKEELHKVLKTIREFIGLELKLELKERVTKIAPVTEGVPFLGFRIFKNLMRLQRPNLVRLRRNVRKREKAYREGKISQEDLIRSVNSMVGYLRYSDSTRVRQDIFTGSKGLV